MVWDIDLKKPTKNAIYSIRLRLLSSLLLPLILLCITSATIAYSMAAGFANDAYDHELINSADSVVARLKLQGNRVVVDLPPAAQAILRHNDLDKFYYQVLRANGERISGDALLPAPRHNLDADAPVFRYAQLNGHDIRMARVRAEIPGVQPELLNVPKVLANDSPGGVSAPVTVSERAVIDGSFIGPVAFAPPSPPPVPNQVVLVQVAETLNSRHHLAQQILLSIIVPQLVLILLGALAVSRAVSDALHPLHKLAKSIAERSQYDLSPVSEETAPIEVKPLLVAINDLLARLRVDLDSQRRFVANAAHQFRTPLAALKTYLYCAKRLPADKEMNEMLDKVDASTERMSHLSSKLLALSKAEPANAQEEYGSVNLTDVVSAAIAGLATEAAKRETELSFVPPAEPVYVRGDAHNLEELAANLIENAVFYTPAGGSVRVSLSASPRCILTVEDNGPGIPEAEKERIFERFYRVLGSEIAGSGLGLAIVKEIAAAHEARVSVCDPPIGSGTIVIVQF